MSKENKILNLCNKKLLEAVLRCNLQESELIQYRHLIKPTYLNKYNRKKLFLLLHNFNYISQLLEMKKYARIHCSISSNNSNFSNFFLQIYLDCSLIQLIIK